VTPRRARRRSYENNAVRAFSNIVLIVAMATRRLNAQEHPQTRTSEAVNADELVAVASYWTPERLAAAKPMDLIKVDPGVTPSPTHPREQGPPGFAKGAPPTGKVSADVSQQLIQALGSESQAGPSK